MPRADAAAQAISPQTIPSVTAKASRLPPDRAARVTRAMSAPGVIVSSIATPAKAAIAEGSI